jgi:hypothetical protein
MMWTVFPEKGASKEPRIVRDDTVGTAFDQGFYKLRLVHRPDVDGDGGEAVLGRERCCAAMAGPDDVAVARRSSIRRRGE